MHFALIKTLPFVPTSYIPKDLEADVSSLIKRTLQTMTEGEIRTAIEANIITVLWKAKVSAEGLERVASVHISLPTIIKSGKWHGNGISEKPWRKWLGCHIFKNINLR
jgi:hypothetical protein